MTRTMPISPADLQTTGSHGTYPLVRISIIIPTLNEETCIGVAIERARLLQPAEIIVVDGGSDDGTVAAANFADQVLTAPRGRAFQQNAGAAACSGDVLLFLHADCWLEPGSLKQIAAALADPLCIGGCFRQQIDAKGRRFRWLERGNTLRVKLSWLAYGDQGIFVRREVFHQVGGFPPVRLMEDLYLMKRLRQRRLASRIALSVRDATIDHGGHEAASATVQSRLPCPSPPKRAGEWLALLDGPLHVSARRWEKRGVVRQTARNWCLTLLAQLGVSPNRLAKFYPDVR